MVSNIATYLLVYGFDSFLRDRKSVIRVHFISRFRK